MGAEAIKSRAFQRAALKSEKYRVTGLLVLLIAMLAFVVARGLLTGEYLRVVPHLIVLAIVIAHEISMRRTIKAALNGEREISPEKWVINVVVESQIPTIAMLLLLATSWFTPYQVLVAPAISIYFLLIILSTLRLSPSLSLLTGILSTIGYLFVTFFVIFETEQAEPGAFRNVVYFVYAGVITTAGILAAAVAGEIRIHVAAALREAELEGELERVNHDLGVARSIQQGLLPSTPPNLDHFEIAGWNQPADQTGGDYFDWQQLPDGRLAVSLGDATGHGIGPALVSTSCRAYARASVLAADSSNGLLNRMNRLLADDLSANRFVTFAVAFLDPKESRVQVLSAGHGPILFYRREADVIKNLDAQGIPLGMIASVEYDHGLEETFEDGDMLVLVTDGFYEWENPQGEEFGLKRLEQVIRDARDCSADEVITKLRQAVETFCKGTEQKDDLTALVLKRKR